MVAHLGFDWVRDDGYDAVLFDLDGTLVNTEPQTGMAIQAVLQGYGIEDGALPARLTGGCTWEAITGSLFAKYPSLVGQVEAGILEQGLIDSWAVFVGKVVEEVPGACRAVEEAAQHMEVGVVSGSPRWLVDKLLNALGISHLVPLGSRVGGEQMTASKPDPAGFLQSAAYLGIAPERCLVFEDSIAGVMSAKAAGMTCVTLTRFCGEIDACLAHADGAIEDFEALPPSFWATIANEDREESVA